MMTQAEHNTTHHTNTMQRAAWMTCASAAKRTAQSQHTAAQSQAAMQAGMQSDSGTHPLTDLNR